MEVPARARREVAVVVHVVDSLWAEQRPAAPSMPRQSWRLDNMAFKGEIAFRLGGGRTVEVYWRFVSRDYMFLNEQTDPARAAGNTQVPTTGKLILTL